MEFIETPIFTKWVSETITDDSYRELQALLIKNPEFGKIIKGCNGIRKIRWKIGTKGKSGGARIIYYYRNVEGQIYMLFAYSKKEQGDLTGTQRKILADYERGL